MTLTLTDGLRNALANAIDDYANAGTAPELWFETSADAEVAKMTLNATSVFDAAGTGGVGVIQLQNTPLQDTNAAGGLIEHFSIYQDGTQTGKVLEGTVGTSGESINITNLTITAGETVELTSFSITVPA